LLIEAFARFQTEMESLGHAEFGPKGSWSLVLLGDGPLRAAVEAQVAACGLGRFVQFRGAIPYAELPTYYGLAGAFVHASKVEQWGLVVNEAMASGLPVVVSNRCGCAADLVADGENGLLFDPSDPVALSQCLLDIAQQDERRNAMGRASRERVREWGPDRFAQGMCDAVMCARGSGPARRDWFGGVLLQLLSKWSA
jgi:glycosyltransferase involved in cell wall biosynthesis